MARSSGKAATVGDDDGGEEQNMTSLESVERSGSADRGREWREVGWMWGIAQYAWACCFWTIGLFRSHAEPTSNQSVSCSKDEPKDEPTSFRSWYHSARIQRMINKSGEFSTEVGSSKVESEIEASKVHWSEVDRAVSGTEHSAEANRKYYEVLRCRRYAREWGKLQLDEREYGSFFFPERYCDDLVVGEKLAEGEQA